jgi:hypothetical protein
MKSIVVSLVKNMLLVSILLITLFNFFNHFIKWNDLFITQLITGFFYLILSCYEILNSTFISSLNINRFPYFSNSYIMFRTLKTTVFFLISVLLFLTTNAVKNLYPICLTLAFAELIVNYLKYKKHLCYVYLSTNFLILAENKQTKLFANEISLIEYRHEILYFVKKDGKSIQIKLEHINQKTMFLTKIYDWVLKNNISVGKESNEKMINEVNLK